ncbi:ribosomal large subunit pseudouridine synthase B-like [Erinaceus europaeus]|uniref:Ribosomal large subunit pseudouridine synthase B-like n=1 Tax=Erinaceus europaeus TaxID=9365 RepID=A0ABM3XTF1_ERIEU|nr:ribosomal large subunit pseudouridine synthase B-like [Erinaceus europaeus]
MSPLTEGNAKSGAEARQGKAGQEKGKGKEREGEARRGKHKGLAAQARPARPAVNLTDATGPPGHAHVGPRGPGRGGPTARRPQGKLPPRRAPDSHRKGPSGCRAGARAGSARGEGRRTQSPGANQPPEKNNNNNNNNKGAGVGGFPRGVWGRTGTQKPSWEFIKKKRI